MVFSSCEPPAIRQDIRVIDSVLSGKKILILQQRGWGLNIGHFLAQQLQKEGCRLAALTIKGVTHDFTLAQEDVAYENVYSGDEVKWDPEAYLGDEDIKLETVCRDLGIDTVWPLIQASRNHAKNYSDRYYFSFRQQASDDEIKNFIKANYKHIRDIFNSFSPDFVLAPNFAGLQHIMMNLYANKRGIEMMAIIDSKVKGVTVFNFHYLGRRNRFLNRIDALNRGVVSENNQRAEEYIKVVRANFSACVKKTERSLPLRPSYRETLGWFKRGAIKLLRFYKNQKARERENAHLVTVDTASSRLILRDSFQSYKHMRNALGFDYGDLSACSNFAYFPLQVQPESTIDIHAVRCNNQIETVRQVAMSLPDDLNLVVKDHPSMRARRPISYLEKISLLPNVTLLDSRVPSEVVLDNARIVISPSSTTLAEAAMLGKPAVQLGDLGTTAKLPNVTRHPNYDSLAACIREILAHYAGNQPQYEQRLRNYVAAAFDTGFELDYYAVWAGDQKGDMFALWEKYRDEISYALEGSLEPSLRLNDVS